MLLQNEEKALEHVRTQLVQEEEERQKSGTARLNVSRQGDGGRPHPERQAAAGQRGTKRGATAEREKKGRNVSEAGKGGPGRR